MQKELSSSSSSSSAFSAESAKEMLTDAVSWLKLLEYSPSHVYQSIPLLISLSQAILALTCRDKERGSSLFISFVSGLSAFPVQMGKKDLTNISCCAEHFAQGKKDDKHIEPFVIFCKALAIYLCNAGVGYFTVSQGSVKKIREQCIEYLKKYDIRQTKFQAECAKWILSTTNKKGFNPYPTIRDFTLALGQKLFVGIGSLTN